MTRLIPVLGLAVLLAFACGDSSPRPTPPAPFASQGASPSGAPTSTPVPPPAPARMSTAESDPAVLQCGSLAFPKPAGWTWVQPTAPFRTLQYVVPGTAGPGDLIVSAFPKGDGGALEANVTRWRGQFAAADGGEAPMTRRDLQVAGMPVTRLDFEGTFQGGMGQPPREGVRQLAAIVQGPDQTLFIRLIGPAESVEGARADFEAMIAGVRAGE